MSDETSDLRAIRLRAADEAHSAHRHAVATSFAPLVAMGAEILKVVALINGGAAIATIFLFAETLRERPAFALALVPPLAAFGFGLTVAGCATGWSYFSHEQFARALALEERTWSEPFIVETEGSRAAARRGARYRGLALGAVMVGIASAVIGFAAAGLTMILMLR